MFQQAIEDGGVTLSEQEEIERDAEPGINYDDEFEYNDLIRRQKMEAEPSLKTKYGLNKEKASLNFKRNPFY